MVLLIATVFVAGCNSKSSSLNYKWVKGDAKLKSGETARLRIEAVNNGDKTKEFLVVFGMEDPRFLEVRSNGERIHKLSLGTAEPQGETQAKVVEIKGTSDISKANVKLGLTLYSEGEKLETRDIDIEIIGK